MFKLELEQNEVVLIGEALGYMPFSKVAQLMGKLQQQINSQQNNDSVSNDSVSE